MSIFFRQADDFLTHQTQTTEKIYELCVECKKKRADTRGSMNMSTESELLYRVRANEGLLL